MHERESTLATDRGRRPIRFTELAWHSDDAAWSGFALERHRVGPAGMLKDFAVPQPLLGLCLGGSAQLDIGDGRQAQRAVMGTGRFILLDRGEQRHSIAWTGTRETLYVRLQADRLAQLLPEAAGDGRLRLTPQFAASDRQVLRLALCLLDEARAGAPSGPAYAEALSLALATCLVRRYAGPPLAEAPGKALRTAIAARVAEHVRAHLDRPVSLVELAGVAGFSPHYFLAMFRNTFGTTPHQYLLRERIARARALLRGDGASISEIGLALGFADQSHFTSTFRRVTGTTPKQFREARGAGLRTIPPDAGGSC